jgi:hypothetical protein
LPHKILQPELFIQKTIQLGNWFHDEKDKDFLLKKEYHKNIPIDGFPKFAESIWEKIISNKDLDLPTQQELLAQYRCDEIAGASFETVSSAVKPLQKSLDLGQVVPDMAKTFEDLRANAIESFSKDAHRYKESVYLKIKGELKTKIDNHLFVLFTGQLRNIYKQSLNVFHKCYKEEISKLHDFSVVVGKGIDSCLEYFSTQASQSLLSETEWTFEETLKQLDDEVQEIIVTKREEEIQKIVNGISKDILKSYIEPIGALFFDPSDGLWRKSFVKYENAQSALKERLEKKLNGKKL